MADSCNQFKWCHLFSNLRACVTIDSILHAPFIHSFQSFIIHDGGDDGGGGGGDGGGDGGDGGGDGGGGGNLFQLAPLTCQSQVNQPQDSIINQ